MYMYFNIESGSDTTLDVKASVFLHHLRTKKVPLPSLGQ